jgi:hypothetical protein
MPKTQVNPKNRQSAVTSMLRKIARQRLRSANMNEKTNKVRCGSITFDDTKFLCKFVSESGFYLEELERNIGEQLHDFWETREHALRILTGVLLQESPIQKDE